MVLGYAAIGSTASSSKDDLSKFNTNEASTQLLAAGCVPYLCSIENLSTLYMASASRFSTFFQREFSETPLWVLQNSTWAPGRAREGLVDGGLAKPSKRN